MSATPTPFGRAWTAAEDRAVAERYATDGAGRLAVELDRTVAAVHHRARRLHALSKPRWTQRQDHLLELLWGEISLTQMAKKLGRTVKAIYWRANDLGLPLGAPDGREYLSGAAVRTGYAVQTLRIILAASGVEPQRAPTSSTRARRPRHLVDPFDVDEAIATWLSRESLFGAARRREIHATTLERRLLALGDAALPPKPLGKRWLIPSALTDRAMEATA